MWFSPIPSPPPGTKGRGILSMVFPGFMNYVMLTTWLDQTGKKIKPVGSMYGTYTYIYQYHKSQPHVGKYTIHYGSYGKELTTRNDDENDDDERHQVTIDEFIDGTMKLKGAAKSTDSPEMWVKLVWGYVKFKVVCISIRLNLRFQRVTKCIYMFVCFGVFFGLAHLIHDFEPGFK